MTDPLDVLAHEDHDPDAAPRPGRRLGVVAFLLAVGLLVVDGVAFALLSADLVQAAAVTALVTLVGSVLVGVVALVAAGTGRGRWWGVAGVLVAVLANPFVLVFLLGRGVVAGLW